MHAGQSFNQLSPIPSPSQKLCPVERMPAAVLHSKADYFPSFRRPNGSPTPTPPFFGLKCLSENGSHFFMSHSASHLLTRATDSNTLLGSSCFCFSLVNLPFIWEIASGNLEGWRETEHFDNFKLVVLKEEAGQRANSIVLTVKRAGWFLLVRFLVSPFLAVGCHPVECSLKSSRAQDSWTQDRFNRDN